VQFGLIHGAWHGAWCFDPLAAELEAAGHGVTAVDLPCDDIEAGAVRYAELVDAALPLDPDLILVGHSLGGLTVPLVAARRPVRRLVFLCALIPVPGASFAHQLRADSGIFAAGFADDPGRLRDEQGRTHWEPDAAVSRFYHDCPPEAARDAVRRLRPQAATPSREICPPGQQLGSDPVSIVCRSDRAIDPEWSRRAARERLGVDAIEIDGGHSPFLARPAELAALLMAL
jgi:pimeloyl-ACP methyl ester carboxylesterase